MPTQCVVELLYILYKGTPQLVFSLSPISISRATELPLVLNSNQESAFTSANIKSLLCLLRDVRK